MRALQSQVLCDDASKFTTQKDGMEDVARASRWVSSGFRDGAHLLVLHVLTSILSKYLYLLAHRRRLQWPRGGRLPRRTRSSAPP